MDTYLTIEFDKWGFTFSTAPYYFSISWGGLIILIAGVIAYKIIKRRKNSRKFQNNRRVRLTKWAAARKRVRAFCLL